MREYECRRHHGHDLDEGCVARLFARGVPGLLSSYLKRGIPELAARFDKEGLGVREQHAWVARLRDVVNLESEMRREEWPRASRRGHNRIGKC
jgi:hypothetical protein